MVELPQYTNIKKYRKKSGMTQKQVADKLNITQTGYGKYELNKSEPDIKTLKQLSRIFNTTIDNLVGNYVNETITINELTKVEQITIKKLFELQNEEDYKIIYDIIDELQKLSKKNYDFFDFVEDLYNRNKEKIEIIKEYKKNHKQWKQL